jgi:rhodanese-related sulfurtransferase
MKKMKTTFTAIIVFVFCSTLWAQDTKVKQEGISFETFESKLKQASPNPQILDARTAEEYKRDHLAGAVNVSLANEVELQKQIDKLDKKKPVFVYSINNGRSSVLVKKLKEQNFTEAYELPGGISKWVGAGRPVETTVGNGLSVSEYHQLIKSDKLVLVDVHSKFCGGCKRLLPTVDSVAREQSHVLKVVKIELFDNKQLGKELNIESIPTLILYKGDKIVWQKTGVTSKSAIEAVIKEEIALK